MDKKSRITNANAYMKYSGMAFQLVALVLLSFYFGRWLDNKMGFKNPYIGMCMILLVFTLYMYKLYKDLINERK